MFRKFLPLALFFIVVVAHSQEFENRYQKVFENAHNNFPEVGLVVSVSKGDSLIWERAAGYSDRAFEIKTAADHKFRIGSITKQFTSVAILKLAEEHKLSLQDTLIQYFPDLKGGEHITIEHLLTHTSGIMDYTIKPQWAPKFSKLFTSPVEVYDFIKEDSLRFEPGSRYEYNNSGYHLLGLIIEKVSGMSYSDYLQKTIFTPLEMTNTLALDSRRVIKNMAKAYNTFGDTVAYAEFIQPAQPFAAGNLVSTTEDLQKWYNGLLAGEIIKKESLEKAFEPFTLHDGSQTSYGYGWQVRTDNDRTVLHHNGSYPGYISEVHYFPESGILITALSNAMPLSRLMKDLTAVSQGKEVQELHFLELSEDELSGFTNVYANDSETWNFTTEKGQLFYSVNQGPKTRILPVSSKKFYSPDWDIFVEFVADSNKKFSSFLLHWNGEKYPYSLVK